MSASCCGPKNFSNSPAWRAALWIALALNAGMFFVEFYVGAEADSRALMADALDFFADAANYAISLAVAGMALVWRARAALFKGWTLALLGAVVLASAAYSILAGSSPDPRAMGIVAVLALLVNFGVAALLYRFRDGDSNMRSVWICSRNDAVGNIAVVAAAAGVFGTGTGWPDIAVAAIMAALALQGAWTVIRQAAAELRRHDYATAAE